MDAALILLSQINAWQWGGDEKFELNQHCLSVLKQLGANETPAVLVNK